MWQQLAIMAAGKALDFGMKKAFGGSGSSGGSGGLSTELALRKDRRDTTMWARDRVSGNVGRAARTAFVQPTRKANTSDNTGDSYVKALVQIAATNALGTQRQQAAFKDALAYTEGGVKDTWVVDRYGTYPKPASPTPFSVG